MSILSKISLATATLLSFSSCTAQIKNAKQGNVKIYGNCEMCEEAIETAGSIKKVANVDWNKDSKMAEITYDSTKTNQDEILKRIALAGYDSDLYLAPDEAYNKLQECCRYKRVNKTALAQSIGKSDQSVAKNDTAIKSTKSANELKVIYENYFALKNALVSSDSKKANEIADNLHSNINSVNMSNMTPEEHNAWMKVLETLKSTTGKISTSENIDTQRSHFMELSRDFYVLLKASKQETPVYYQYCPMYNDGKGAYWLSQEKAVKNPYYGSEMLTCGKVVETIE